MLGKADTARYFQFSKISRFFQKFKYFRKRDHQFFDNKLFQMIIKAQHESNRVMALRWARFWIFIISLLVTSILTIYWTTRNAQSA